MKSAADDVRYAFRSLRRHPGFAATVLLTIAVGTGALSSVLAVVHAVLLRPAPYADADRIVQIGQVVRGRNRTEVSAVDVLALRAGSPSLSHVTTTWFSETSVAGDGFPSRARLVYTDAQAFEMLGVAPLVGRMPSRFDEAPDAAPVVVIGHRLWMERFGGDREVVGRTIRVNAEPHTVIGVMPPHFRFPAPYWAAGDLWLLRGAAHPSWPRSRTRLLLAFGRLKEGHTLERAQQEADAVAAALDAQYPGSAGPVGLELTAWAETEKSEARPRLLFILGAAGVVFLIVCVNVASLLLTRGLERQRELAARVALGAPRWRLMRQLLTDTAVLFAIGGAAGVPLGTWGARLIASIPSARIPRMDEAAVDVPVAALSLAVTAIAGVIVGLVPALQAATARMHALTDAGARGSSRGRGWRRMQKGLVAAQIGLALVLVSGAAVLVEGAWRLARVDPGFDPARLTQARVTLPRPKYESLAAQASFYERVLEGVRGAGGIDAAAAVNVPPGTGGAPRPAILLDGDEIPRDEAGLRQAQIRVVSAGYFDTLGLAPRAGRFFSAADRGAGPVAIVNEAFMRRYLDGRDPVGGRLRVGWRGVESLDEMPRTIVGVAPDVKEGAIFAPPPPTVYLPLGQEDATRMAIVVRSARPASEVMAAVKAAMAGADPDVAAYDFLPLRGLWDRELSLNRLNVSLLGVLAAVALFLSITGVYGVTAHAVRQRRREIGIRIALGTTPSGVQRLVISEGGALIAAGLVCGGVAAVWSAGVLRSLVQGIERTSPLTFVIAAAVLSTAVLGGCYFPARRASRVDPAIVLRNE